jgi:hypothetical protein
MGAHFRLSDIAREAFWRIAARAAPSASSAASAAVSGNAVGAWTGARIFGDRSPDDLLFDLGVGFFGECWLGDQARRGKDHKPEWFHVVYPPTQERSCAENPRESSQPQVSVPIDRP